MPRVSRTRRFLVAWLPFAVGITLIAGAAYFFVPRFAGAASSVPLSRAAERIAGELDTGRPLHEIIPTGPMVEVTQASAQYVVVLDSQGKTIASSATLNGKPLTVPTGMFTFVSDEGWDGAQWQVAPGARQEISIRKFQSGYVLVGRKIGSSTDSDPGVQRLVVALWGAGLVAALGLVAFKPVRLRTA